VVIDNASSVILADNSGAINLQTNTTTNNTLTALSVTSTGTVANGSTINNIGTSGVNVSGSANFTVADNQSINLSGDNTFAVDPRFSSATADRINHLTVKDLTDYTVQDNLSIRGDLNITANNIVLQNTTVGSDNTGNLTLGATQLDAASVLIGTISQSTNTADSLVVNGLSTLDARTITLDHMGNNFNGNVVVNNVLSAVTLVDSAGGIQLGDIATAFNVSTLNVTSTGGNISQANAITSTVTVLDARNGGNASDILFNSSNANSLSGNITIKNARNARLDNTSNTTLQTASVNNDLVVNSGGSLTLGTGPVTNTVNVGNDLLVTAAGVIDQTGTQAALMVGGNAQLSARNASNVDQNITLRNTGNRFNTVDIVNAANVDLYDSTGTIGLQGNMSGFINVQAMGSDIVNSVIYDTAELNVGGAATFAVTTGESINLGNIANTFIVDPNFVGALNNLTLSDDTALTLQDNLTLTGNLTVNAQGVTFNTTTLNAAAPGAGNLNVNSGAGGISQNTGKTMRIAGLANLDGGGGGITLGELNDFQNTVTLNTQSADTVNQPSDVVIKDSNGLDIGASSIDGSLTVSAGSVTQTDDGIAGNNDGIRVVNSSLFTVTGGSSVILNNIDNQFNVISFAAANGSSLGSVTISNSNTLDLQSMNLNNDLSATSLGNITNSGTLLVNGLTQLSGVNIALDTASNDFNNVTINQGALVSITDANTLNFAGASNVSDSLTVNALNGNISSDALASLTVTNTASLNSTNGSILLDNNLHDFNIVQLNSTADARITDLNTLDISGSSIAGDLSVVADTSNGGVNNDIINSNGAIVVGGATTLQSSDGANIMLARTGSNHSLSGPVSFTSSGPGRLNSVQINNRVATDLRGVSAIRLVLNSGGNITESGVLDVSLSTTLSSLADINLTASASDNRLNNLSVTAANNVQVADAGALTLSSINITGQLDVDANGITTAANLSIDNGIDLDAGTGVLAINNNLASSAGALALAADQNINLATATRLSGPSVQLTSRGADIIQNGNIVQTQGSGLIPGVELNAADTIVMATNASTQAENDIKYVSLNDQTVSTLVSSNGVISSTTSNGGILDANGVADNYTASRVNLRSLTGIGSADSIETRTAELDVINAGVNAGIVDIRNNGDVLVTNLVNGGDINFNNSSSVTIDNIVADYSVTDSNGGVTYGGSFNFNVDAGSVFGIDRGTGNDFLNIADITADGARILVNGPFGTFTRPIVMKIRSELALFSTISSTFYIGGKPDIFADNSAVQLSIFDSLNSVSGQQLIEVESLADIDPAIFTDLHNYDNEEISIRMPRDQVFEDELEEYDDSQ